MPAKDSVNPTPTGNEEPFSFAEEPSRDERKRYTTQLQRRAQAHITAELGGTTVVPDTDRQVTMVVQHAQNATGARRVSFFRPVTRGRRWHVATVLGDGTFYYGLACPETLSWSRLSFEQRRPVLFDARHSQTEGSPNLSEVGLRSYLGVPVLADGRSVAVIEAVDVNQTGELEYYSSQLEETASTLAQRLDDDNKQIEDAQVKPGSSDLELNADSIVDLVLRQPYEVDETFEVAPTEWAVLNCVNGERQLRAVAEQASMPISQVVSVTSALVDRGLIRVGKENRRRL
jgi:GAF domain-containing protein